MAEDNPYLPWTGINDEVVVKQMQEDLTSVRWNECYEFVSRLVQLRARNIPEDQRDDIIQDAMLRIGRSLSTFKFKCKFRYWIYGIVGTAIIDAHRRRKRIEDHTTLLDDHQEDSEHDGDPHTSLTSSPVEDQCIINDDLLQALAMAREYLSRRAHPERNQYIIELVLLEGRSLEETAQLAGCSAPVVGYVVRTLQQYLRKNRDADE